MAHRREHEDASRAQRVKTWAIASAVLAAFALAAVAAVLSLR
ncbi:hypothetical protein [Glycomyces arizonensis]|nr:hypothetical protein [Glycomyces arizonensis]